MTSDRQPALALAALGLRDEAAAELQRRIDEFNADDEPEWVINAAPDFMERMLASASLREGRAE